MYSDSKVQMVIDPVDPIGGMSAIDVLRPNMQNGETMGFALRSNNTGDDARVVFNFEKVGVRGHYSYIQVNQKDIEGEDTGGTAIAFDHSDGKVIMPLLDPSRVLSLDANKKIGTTETTQSGEPGKLLMMNSTDNTLRINFNNTSDARYGLTAMNPEQGSGNNNLVGIQFGKFCLTAESSRCSYIGHVESMVASNRRMVFGSRENTDLHRYYATGCTALAREIRLNTFDASQPTPDMAYIEGAPFLSSLHYDGMIDYSAADKSFRFKEDGEVKLMENFLELDSSNEIIAYNPGIATGSLINLRIGKEDGKEIELLYFNNTSSSGHARLHVDGSTFLTSYKRDTGTNYTELHTPVQFPSYTSTQMHNISDPQEGMVIFNTTKGSLFIYSDSEWYALVREAEPDEP